MLRREFLEAAAIGCVAPTSLIPREKTRVLVGINYYGTYYKFDGIIDNGWFKFKSLNDSIFHIGPKVLKLKHIKNMLVYDWI